MRRILHFRIRIRALFMGASLLCVAAFSASAGADSYSLDAHIIASGSSVRSSSACFRMDAVIAEPVAGSSSGGLYTLTGGFVAVAAPPNDDIFFSGFEDCTP